MKDKNAAPRDSALKEEGSNFITRSEVATRQAADEPLAYNTAPHSPRHTRQAGWRLRLAM